MDSNEPPQQPGSKNFQPQQVNATHLYDHTTAPVGKPKHFHLSAKQIVLVVGSVVFLAAIAGVGWFYWKNLRGVGPALLPPPSDIGELIDEGAQNDTKLPLKAPYGFSISIFVEGLESPRVLARAPDGSLLVSIAEENGRVVALPDRNSDGVSDETVFLAGGLRNPHGLAVDCRAATEGSPLEEFIPCILYVAEEHEIVAFDLLFGDGGLKVENRRTIAALPEGGNHTTRTLALYNDPVTNESEATLLVSIGSTCDVCQEVDSRHAAISKVNLETGKLEPFATGLRNAVFMAAHPTTGELWATEMGRDFLGDDLPPDEINIVRAGGNYGWPICYGKNIHDEVFDKNVYVRAPCEEPFEQGSYIDLPAHSAPLGLAFIPEDGWPEEYQHDLIVAFHGSWNRTVPTGYKLVHYELDENGAYTSEKDFITGWLTEDNRALGRPADVLIEPAGVMYVSDDKAGVVYRVQYSQ